MNLPIDADVVSVFLATIEDKLVSPKEIILTMAFADETACYKIA